MTNDAKLGLLIGIGLVILIAFFYYRKDPATAQALPPSPLPAAVAAIPSR
jgi:hypothetical protein